MSFKRFGVLAAVALAAGCGGGSDNDGKAPRDPYVEFRVNGVLEPKAITLDWVESTIGGDVDVCDPDTYENGQLVADNEPAFCNRSATNVTFSVRYTNPTYESVDVTYSGVGFEVHVYEYDEAAEDFKGQEVWNSNYQSQLQIIAARDADPDLVVDDFDPDKETTVELEASDSIPSYSGFLSYTFGGDQYFPAGAEDYRVYSAAEIEAFIRDHTYPQTQSCDYILQSGVDPLKARYVQCRGQELLPDPGATDPVKFVASVTVNFNGWTDQPDDIIITLNPPN